MGRVGVSGPIYVFANGGGGGALLEAAAAAVVVVVVVVVVVLVFPEKKNKRKTTTTATTTTTRILCESKEAVEIRVVFGFLVVVGTPRTPRRPRLTSAEI